MYKQFPDSWCFWNQPVKQNIKLLLATKEEIVNIKEFKHARISTVENQPSALLITATRPYIPFEHFKSIFNELGEYVREGHINKLIFDKRQLTVFHQPSMEWYFTVWKEQMFDLGLTQHIKLLPTDEVFRQSVKIGRAKIDDLYPKAKFHKMNILYAESLEQALAL